MDLFQYKKIDSLRHRQRDILRADLDFDDIVDAGEVARGLALAPAQPGRVRRVRLHAACVIREEAAVREDRELSPEPEVRMRLGPACAD